MSDVDIKTETEQMRQIESYLSNYDRKVVENNPEKALEIINKNENTNTVTEVIKNKIEKGEAITGDDFEDVFEKNVSPN